MSTPENGTPEERAAKRAKEYTDVMWHAVTYVIVNLFLWGIDITGGDGVNWAYWVTISWGVGLGFHVASYLIDDNGLKGRKYRKFLAEEREADRGEGPIS